MISDQLTTNDYLTPELSAPPEAGTKSTVDTEHVAICAMCPHPWNNHDQIAARYCTASVTSGQSRGCVCANKEIP
jgi:hypothetical protein